MDEEIKNIGQGKILIRWDGVRGLLVDTETNVVYATDDLWLEYDDNVVKKAFSRGFAEGTEGKSRKEKKK